MTPEPRRRGWPSRPRASAARRSCGCSTCSPPRWRRARTGADAAHAARARARQGGGARGRPVAQRACSRASSGSRRSSRASAVGAPPVEPPPAAPRPQRTGPAAVAAVAVRGPEERARAARGRAGARPRGLPRRVARGPGRRSAARTRCSPALLERRQPGGARGGELRRRLRGAGRVPRARPRGVPNRETLDQASRPSPGARSSSCYELRADAETEEVAAAALSDEELVARFDGRVRRRGARPRGARGELDLMPQPPNMQQCSSRPRRCSRT